MDTAEKILLVVAVLALIAAGTIVGYEQGHEYGYLQGAKHSKLYYVTIDAFPNMTWLEACRGEHFYCPQEIRDTLRPYGD